MDDFGGGEDDWGDDDYSDDDSDDDWRRQLEDAEVPGAGDDSEAGEDDDDDWSDEDYDDDYNWDDWAPTGCVYNLTLEEKLDLLFTNKQLDFTSNFKDKSEKETSYAIMVK